MMSIWLQTRPCKRADMTATWTMIVVLGVIAGLSLLGSAGLARSQLSANAQRLATWRWRLNYVAATAGFVATVAAINVLTRA